ncbi:Acyl-CoA thioester hydrolase YbgC [Vibrio stylophorae]|uniref:Acyl-CoA thioester hydrolase YbgC n=1 Tax=Vibrio stylophorae TaxID=659351 RepID=A0ABM8ZRS9_9VIBR|nr:tol-pal system-associated acyl-CoA thioesterase [Vibrio stylophorae]CAH0533000.1 Acyl-CoA thioester hydrolase YbgC [Vibrio stylophorae]
MAIPSFSWPVRVYYEDTDAGGVVYHANYLKFFERARTEFLRAKGVTQEPLLAQDIAFVVNHMSIDFIQPARLDDALEVVTEVTHMRRVAIEFCQTLVNSAGQCLCRANVQVACINPKKTKPVAIPTTIIAELNRES